MLVASGWPLECIDIRLPIEGSGLWQQFVHHRIMGWYVLATRLKGDRLSQPFSTLGTVKIWDLESLVHDHHDPAVSLVGPAGVVHGVTTTHAGTLTVVAGIQALDSSYLVLWHKPTDV